MAHLVKAVATKPEFNSFPRTHEVEEHGLWQGFLLLPHAYTVSQTDRHTHTYTHTQFFYVKYH